MTELKKNDTAILSVTDMTESGEGIGRIGGYPLFVKDAVIGDELEVLVTKPGKSYGYGRVNRLITPSPDRVTPPCPVAAPCGGCQLQALSYAAQLRFKENTVRQHLTRLGGFAAPAVLPVLGMEEPWRYRNKAQVPFGRDREGNIVCGYYAAHSHRIVPMPKEDCLLNGEGFAAVLRILLDFAREYAIEPYDEESGRGLLRHALLRRGEDSGEWMVSLVINGRKLPHQEELVKRLLTVPGMTDISLSVNTKNTNVIMGEELLPLYGPGFITETVGDLRFRLSPLAFFQVNPRQTERLYQTALDFAGLTGRETVWDLYCGTGSISLFLARRAARVYGVEIIAPAIENARANAAANGIGNAEFFVGRSEEIYPQMTAAHRVPPADVVVLDPPRKGCDQALLDALLKEKPERIVYVSCNSATLARDCRILAAGGYRLEKAQPVDMFCQSCHVETVVLMSRVKE